MRAVPVITVGLCAAAPPVMQLIARVLAAPALCGHVHAAECMLGVENQSNIMSCDLGAEGCSEHEL